MQKITPNLWFDRQAEEAVHHYLSIFRNGRIHRILHYSKAGFETHHMPEGTVLTIEFEIEGQHFVALNGGPGPGFKFNESVSFIIYCDTQEEIDHYWEKLTAGGDPAAQACGWLKDKYGVSWQVTPPILIEMLNDPDREKADRVMAAMMQMKKIDIAAAQRAYRGE